MLPSTWAAIVHIFANDWDSGAINRNNAEILIFVNLFCLHEHIPESTTMYIRCVTPYSAGQADKTSKAVYSCGAVSHELAHRVTFPSTRG